MGDGITRKFALIPVMFLIIMTVAAPSQGGIVQGKVTALLANVIEINIGSEKGIRPGDSGRIYYNVMVDNKERRVYIAGFKVTQISPDSSTAQIEENTGDVRVGLFAEVTFKEAELEVRSEPSGGKVYLDGSERGETPIVLSGLWLGRHTVRVAKEGYAPHEEQVEVQEGDRKVIRPSLKKMAGEILVSTEPEGADISIDGKSVGTSPYEGKGFSLGTHRVRMIKEGYEAWDKDVVVEAGKRAEVLTQLREKKKEVARLPSPARPESPRERAPKEFSKVSRAADLAKKGCQAPVWSMGDRWTYRNTTNSVWTQEVVDVKEDLFIVEISGHMELEAFDRKTINQAFLIGKDGRKVSSADNPFKRLFDFPLSVGKKWSYTARSKVSPPNGRSFEGPFLCEFKVEGVEDVRTPAGTFVSYRIFHRQKIIGSAVGLSSTTDEGWVRYWYSPDTKTWVKREFEKSHFWPETFQDAELVSYELK